MTPRIGSWAAVAAVVSLPLAVRGDSVAQIGTRVGISEQTVALIDPQGRPGVGGEGSDTAVVPGDVLKFIVDFTPVRNGCVRGLGGYVTVYVPRNVEVIGVRFIDRDGNTVAPHRGGLAADGMGPRGDRTFDDPLLQGSLSQVYADTGVFYSTSPLTARVPAGDLAGEQFVSLYNGIEMTMEPTGAGNLLDILGAGTAYAHNVWDYAQVVAMGAGGASFGGGGSGAPPDMYGSPVAGPETFYPYEASYVGVAGGIPDDTNVDHLDTVGPWSRIRTFGAEVGRRGVLPPVPDPGVVTRIGVPAVDGNGDLLGLALTPDAPLPSFDPLDPDAPHTTALRYAVGELVVGDAYYSEVTVRVLDLPLDPVAGDDVLCAEVFGGDCSAETSDGTRGGKDLAWRYFVPAPSCVNLNLFFELEVDRLNALPGDTLTYTIRGKNLSVDEQTNVVVSHCYDAGTVALTDDGGSAAGDGSGCPDPASSERRWLIPRLAPGEELSFTLQFTVTGGNETVHRAVYSSDALPLPGFTATAFTNIDPLTNIDLALEVAPARVDAGARVTYTGTILNSGTGDAEVAGCQAPGCRWIVKLPAGFAYVAGTSAVDGAAVADPAVAGAELSYTTGIVDVLAGGSATLSLQVDVPIGTAAGLYTAALETWLRDAGAGRTVEDEVSGTAPLAVGADRSDVPTIAAPIPAGAIRVSGTTTEAAGTTIRVQVDGNPAGETASAGDGTWAADVPTLVAGQHVTATAQAAAELESLRSAPVVVEDVGGVAPCTDGADNDGDGLVDFPADPGCADGLDADETDELACADGLDNDGDGAVDFPADTSCAGFYDDDESGPPACANAEDDDGDGLTDLDDPDCTDAGDAIEGHAPACANGEDDDGDGQVDYALDPGCEDAADDDEADVPGGDGDADADADADADGDGDGDGDGDADRGDPPERGGVSEDTVDEGGCSCRAGPAAPRPSTAGALLVLFVLALRRRARPPKR